MMLAFKLTCTLEITLGLCVTIVWPALSVATPSNGRGANKMAARGRLLFFPLGLGLVTSSKKVVTKEQPAFFSMVKYY